MGKPPLFGKQLNHQTKKMHDFLRDRILRSIEDLPEERQYQVLDYVEFLASKYARDTRGTATPFRKFSEKLEDRMRLNGLGMGAIKGTMGIVGTADRVMNDLADTGRSLFRDVEKGFRTATERPDQTEVRNRPVPPAVEAPTPPGESDNP